MPRRRLVDTGYCDELLMKKGNKEMGASKLYKEKIIDHYKHPRNFGEMQKFDYRAQVANSVCGDEVTVYLKTKGTTVTEVSFKGSGCAISIAGMSMLSEKLVGMKTSDIGELTHAYVLDLLGMEAKSPRIKCAVLGLDATHRAIRGEEDEPCDFC